MQEGSNGKKVVTGIVVIAAVALIYLFSMHHSQDADTTASMNGTPVTASTQPDSPSTSVASNASYKDGTYTANSSYRVPHSSESIGVTLTVKDGVVTGTSLNQSEDNPESAQYQEMFAETYKSYVVGKKLSDISLNRVSGASLTTGAFDTALQQIRSQAQA